MTPGRCRAGRERSMTGVSGRNVILNVIPDLNVLPDLIVIPDLNVLPDLIGDPNRF